MINIKVEGKEIAKSVCDLFSPLTEIAGTIGDHIRIYRELSVLRTLKRAKEIAQEEGIVLNPPPLKFLIPFLENVSLEENSDDNQLIELWAKLLRSSAYNYKTEYNLFIRILNELSPTEAKVFHYIANSHIHQTYQGHSVHMEDLEAEWDNVFAYNRLQEVLKEYNQKELRNIDFSLIEQKLKMNYQPPGVYIYFFLVNSGNQKKNSFDDWLYDTPRCDFDDLYEPVSISILTSLGLIINFKSPDYWINDMCFVIHAYALTPLGASFYEACVDKQPAN